MGGTESTEIKQRGAQPPFEGGAPLHTATEAQLAPVDTEIQRLTPRRVADAG